jgi:hypothetical protein
VQRFLALRKYGEGKGLLGAPRTPPRTEPESPTSGGSITITVRNKRAEWISVSRTPRAVIARLPMNNVLPNENRIAPGAELTLILPPPALAVQPNLQYVLLTPAIGFVLPQLPPPTR